MIPPTCSSGFIPQARFPLPTLCRIQDFSRNHQFFSQPNLSLSLEIFLTSFSIAFFLSVTILTTPICCVLLNISTQYKQVRASCKPRKIFGQTEPFTSPQRHNEKHHKKISDALTGNANS